MWGGAVRGFTRKSFSQKHRMDVVFTDDDGAREGSVDFGGPKREFFTELMDVLPGKAMFSGENTVKLLTNDVTSKQSVT